MGQVGGCGCRLGVRLSLTMRRNVGQAGGCGLYLGSAKQPALTSEVNISDTVILSSGDTV